MEMSWLIRCCLGLLASSAFHSSAWSLGDAEGKEEEGGTLTTSAREGG